MTLAISHYPNPNLEHFGHTVAHWQQNIAKLWLTLRAARSGKASLAAYQCQPPSIDPGIGRIGWDFDPASDWYPFSFVDLKCAFKWCGWTTSTITITCIAAKNATFATSSLVLQQEIPDVDLLGEQVGTSAEWVDWIRFQLILSAWSSSQALEKPLGITCCSKTSACLEGLCQANGRACIYSQRSLAGLKMCQEVYGLKATGHFQVVSNRRRCRKYGSKAGIFDARHLHWKQTCKILTSSLIDFFPDSFCVFQKAWIESCRILILSFNSMCQYNFLTILWR